MARDLFHNQVKTALIKDGWKITHDPYSVKISEAIKVQIDLGAESTIAAQRDQEKIAVEIKSFISDSDISEFHVALGQYLNYLQALELKDPQRILYGSPGFAMIRQSYILLCLGFSRRSTNILYFPVHFPP